MNLYIRTIPEGRFVTFVQSVSELKDVVASYCGQRIILGDLQFFNGSMLNVLLKFTEEYNDTVDLFSTKDVQLRPLLSRVTSITKAPVSTYEVHFKKPLLALQVLSLHPKFQKLLQ